MTDHLLFLQANWPWFAALVVAFMAGAQAENAWSKYTYRSRRRSGTTRRFGGASASLRPVMPASAPFDAAEQLRRVECASFQKRRLLNRGEARLFGILERACAAEAPDWRVMVQVSLGEVLSSPDEEAYRAINSKRVDLLIVGPDGKPLHAIEFQGSGHHLGPAATRDAVKKEALRKAGVGYVEVMPGDTPAEIRSLVGKLARRAKEEASVQPHSAAS